MRPAANLPICGMVGRCVSGVDRRQKEPCRQSGTSTCRATFQPVFIDKKRANQRQRKFNGALSTRHEIRRVLEAQTTREQHSGNAAAKRIVGPGSLAVLVSPTQQLRFNISKFGHQDLVALVCLKLRIRPSKLREGTDNTLYLLGNTARGGIFPGSDSNLRQRFMVGVTLCDLHQLADEVYSGLHARLDFGDTLLNALGMALQGVVHHDQEHDDAKRHHEKKANEGYQISHQNSCPLNAQPGGAPSASATLPTIRSTSTISPVVSPPKAVSPHGCPKMR